jgi:hypothetical protein
VALDEPGDDLDSSGNIYVISQSSSGGLDTLGSFIPGNASGRVEAVTAYQCGECTDASPSGRVERHHVTKLFTSVLVTKFSPDGKTVLFATYFNGNPAQNLKVGVNSAAVSAAGEVNFRNRHTNGCRPATGQLDTDLLSHPKQCLRGQAEQRRHRPGLWHVPADR